MATVVGTPRGEIEPYRVGDRVRWWQAAVGWRHGRIVGVRDKAIDIVPDHAMAGDPRAELAIRKHRAVVVPSP